ncbi:MAG: divalent-cation tolerance protein CutA [Candidatus Woesearchaeota archaeon]
MKKNEKNFHKKNKKYLVIITTTNTRENAEKILKVLLEKRLVACAQILKTNSFYWWKNKIENSKEYLIILKTKKEFYDIVEKTIKENHNYEIPEIISLDIKKGYDKYLSWIDETLSIKNKRKSKK